MASDVFGILGTTLERKYRIDKVIGEGGFGVVYRGHHLGFDAPIAIKCLKMPMHFTDEARSVFYTRFQEEGKLLLRLSGEHLSIVRVFDFGVAVTQGAQFPYLVLEWLEGQDLQAHLRTRADAKKPPLGEVDALKLLRPAIEALGVAHRAGVAHRDIKPENLFLIRNERGHVIKVLDFGIAKVMHEGETATQVGGTNTSSGFRAFSPNHGAPEQFSAKRYGATGPWTDVHALGLILVEMVTGRRALDGDELIDVLDAAVKEPRPTPRSRGAIVSDGFEGLCLRALAVQSRERFRDADDMLAAVDRLLVASGDAPTSGGSGRASSTTAVDATIPDPPSFSRPISSRERGEPTAPGGPVLGAAPLHAPTLQDAPPSRAPKLVIGGAALAIALGLGVFAVTRKVDPPEDAAATTSVASAAPTVVLSVAGSPGGTASPRARRMIAVPAATFNMGSAEGSADEKPVHAATVTAFELDETEVTVADFKLCVNAAACREPDGGVDCNWGARERADHPINCVSFHDATAYCTYAKKRLPTEDEWELAARGANGARFPWGGAEPVLGGPELCWGRRAAGEGTCAVASHPAGKSPLGIQDLAGNVSEWTSSRFCPYSSKGCTAESRVVRGGAWLAATPSAVTSTRRQKESPDNRSSVTGFRCARSGG